MIDHVSIAVPDLPSAGRFYDEVLAPLGLSRLVVRTGSIGYGKRYPEFWLNHRSAVSPEGYPGSHVCLRAPDERAVRRFHSRGLEHGAVDDGAPGPRPAAVTEYFGAFLIDPYGNRIEAVTFPRSAAGALAVGTDAPEKARNERGSVE